ERCGGKHGDDSFGNVGQPSRYSIAGLHACGVERESECSYGLAQFTVTNCALVSFLVPRRQRRPVIGEAKKILGEVQAGVGKPARPFFRIGRTHVVEADTNALSTTASAAMSDDSAESPRQRPETLRIVYRPLVDLPVGIGR